MGVARWHGCFCGEREGIRALLKMLFLVSEAVFVGNVFLRWQLVLLPDGMDDTGLTVALLIIINGLPLYSYRIAPSFENFHLLSGRDHMMFGSVHLLS